jgi:hypothetical protein
MPTPEELARRNIDALLEKCGWKLQTRATINLDAAQGELLVDAKIISADKLQPLRAECDELTDIFVTILKRSKEP